MYTTVIENLPKLVAAVREGNAILIADGGLRVDTTLFPIGEFVNVKIDFTKEIDLGGRPSQSTNPRMKAANGGVKEVINGSMYLDINGQVKQVPISGSQVMAACLIYKTRTGANTTIGDVYAKSRIVNTTRNGQPVELTVLDLYFEGKEDKNRPYLIVDERNGNTFVRFNSKDTDISLFGVSLTVTQGQNQGTGSPV